MSFACVFDVNNFLRYMICFLSIMKYVGSSPISPKSDNFGVDLGALTIFPYSNEEIIVDLFYLILHLRLYISMYLILCCDSLFFKVAF